MADPAPRAHNSQISYSDLSFLGEAVDLIETAHRSSYTVEHVADIHARVDAILGLSWLTTQLDNHVASNWWDSMAAATVRDEISDRHHTLVSAILRLDTDSVDHWQTQTRSQSVGSTAWSPNYVAME